MVEKKVACSVCGKVTTQKGNKPKEYCGADCRELKTRLNQLIDCMVKVKLEGNYKKMMKGELFSLANII